MNLKFRNRIAFFNTIAVAATTALVYIIIYIVVIKTSYAHLDEDIIIEKDEVFSNLDWHRDSIIIYKMPEWEEAEHNKVEVNPTFLQIVDLKGKVVFHSSNLLKDQFLYNPNNTQETFYNSEISNQKIRLGQFPIRNKNNKIIGQLTIAISQQESYSILNSLLIVLLVSFPLVLIIQFITSSFAAAKSIQPVHQLIKTASGISDFNIGTRLILPKRRDELFELTKTINELLERIENSIYQQKQFTSDASHEIRTPLAAIRGTLEVLIRKHREPEVYKEKIVGIIEQVDRLNDLLEQLLQLTRIESGVAVAKKEKVSLVSILDSCISKLNASIVQKNISIHRNIPKNTLVIADKLFLEIIIINLLSNALKYGNNDGNIYLVWDDTINTFTIKDDGIGISIENLSNIFDRFYRVDASRSSLIKGNGLGLSIVKKLCDMQGLIISVNSKLNEGSTFAIKFNQ